MEKAIVDFQRVSKYLNQRKILSEIDLKIQDGKITCILGPSGSGKTTLLRLINALLLPDSGRIEVFGKEISRKNLHLFRRKIGYSVQGNLLFPHLTVGQNLALLPRLEKWDESRIENRSVELLELVNLNSSFLGRFPHELSGGQAQRVGLCRALFLNPELVLLDEPFGALDPLVRSSIQDELLHIQAREPRCIVLVTHDTTEAVRLADYILMMDKGKVVQFGTKSEILECPASDFVRSYFAGEIT